MSWFLPKTLNMTGELAQDGITFLRNDIRCALNDQPAEKFQELIKEGRSEAWALKVVNQTFAANYKVQDLQAAKKSNP